MEYQTKHDDKATMFYENGVKRSDRTGKGRYDLISPFALERLAKVYERGAISKGPRNWEAGFEWSRCLDSACRHINQYRMGHRDEDHIVQAIWNLFALVHFEETGTGTDDIPKYTK